MNILTELENGNFEAVGKKLLSLFKTDVVDPVEVFVNRFLSDFGKFAISEAAKFVPDLISGATTIPVAGAQILADAEKAAVTMAEQDALAVAQDALRVQFTAAQTSPTSPVSVDPQPAS